MHGFELPTAAIATTEPRTCFGPGMAPGLTASSLLPLLYAG
jgi:hypothetical protein